MPLSTKWENDLKDQSVVPLLELKAGTPVAVRAHMLTEALLPTASNGTQGSS